MMRRETDDMDSLRIPRWLLPVLAMTFLGLCGTGITTWAKANANDQRLENHDRRIEQLEKEFQALNQKMAEVGQNVKDMKETQDSNSGKLDRVLELEMSHK